MKTNKKCPNCGADNDLLLTNCMFCKSPLSEVDLDSISNEELIQNAGEWVGKVGSSFIYYGKNHNQWTGKGIITYSANQIEGLAQKYLSLLQARSISNQNISLIYSDLKTEFDNKRKGILYKLGGGDKEKGSTYLFAIIFFLVMLLVPIIVSISIN